MKFIRRLMEIKEEQLLWEQRQQSYLESIDMTLTGILNEINLGGYKMKPIRLKVSPKTQAGDIFLFKEGTGMCQDGIVHIEQLGFCNERMTISFEKSKIPKIIEALKKLPTLTESNQEEFSKEMEEYFNDAS